MTDDLSVREGAWVREPVQGRGASVLLLPSYSPDSDPTGEASSKVKRSLREAKARTLGALFEATHRALSAVTAEDASGFFEHCAHAAPRAQTI